jgi:hypothetical protein
MGNKSSSYDTLTEETKDLLMQRTGKKIFIITFCSNICGMCTF